MHYVGTRFQLMHNEGVAPLQNLMVTEYELMWEPRSLTSVSLRLRRGHCAYHSWAIVKNTNCCLGKTPNKHGRFTFNYEPLPSSRDSDYFREYRFDTAENAYCFWAANRERIIVTPAEDMAFIKATRGVSNAIEQTTN